ncbi:MULTISPECIES: hypothetical protein [Brachybacterium]|uniref:hypothetical protein n=1 Tax=Brachybacterium TaxID=43668 RepID=UPI0011DFC298|nr:MULTISPECIES: hypothetical protein [Brachybacterium]
MDILSVEQYEVMAFVAACNQNYYNPTRTQVELWRNNREPSEAVYRTTRRKVSEGTLTGDFFGLQTASNRMVASIVGDSFRPFREMFASRIGPFANLGPVAGPRYVTERELVSPAESTVGHLVRLTWLAEITAPADGEAGLRLTDLGRALLRDAETGDESEEEVSVVLLGREDPLAYPILVGQLAAAGPGMFVDPYLKLADLHTIIVSTQLTRLLVSGKMNNCREIGAMQAYLGRGSLSRRVEVRASTGLHDRVLVADDGDVLTVGTSLNGVGKTTTVVSPMPSPARESLRDEYEHLWVEATLVGPQPEDEDADADDGESADDASGKSE